MEPDAPTDARIPPPTRSLVRKLAEVMAVIERVPKNGYNDFHKYAYAMEADIVAAVRQELALRQVMLIPAVTGRTRVPVGEKGNVLTLLDMAFTFYDGESGEEIRQPWSGAGADKEDKGDYKAMTGAEKYFILKTFLMPTGDDPEDSGGTQQARGRKPLPRSSAATARTQLPPPEVPARDPNDTRPITTKGEDGKAGGMLGRLKKILREQHVDMPVFAVWMRETYGYAEGKDIQRKDYDAIVAQAEKGGPPTGWAPKA